MITATYPDGKEITRNKSHFKLLDPKPEELLVREPEPEIEPVINVPENKESKSKTPGGDKQSNEPERSIARDRPRRISKKPQRYCMSLMIEMDVVFL